MTAKEEKPRKASEKTLILQNMVEVWTKTMEWVDLKHITFMNFCALILEY